MPPLPKKVSKPAQSAPVKGAVKSDNPSPTNLPKSAKEVAKVWVSQPVRIVCTEDGKDKWVVVQGRRLAQVAIHPCLKQDGTGWRVTAVTTGLAFCKVETEDDATKIAAVAAVYCQDALALSDPKGQARAFPAWARLWLRACTRAGKWVETTDYEVHRN